MRRDFEKPPPRLMREPNRNYARRRFLAAGLVFLIVFVIFPSIMLGIYFVMTWMRSMNRLDDADIARAVADLRSPNPAVKQEAVNRLRNVNPDPSRREVAEALKPLLQEENVFLRQNVLQALGGWGNAEDAVAVTPLLKDQNHATRWPAIKTLEQLKGKVAAEALVKHLANVQDRGFTTDALKRIGPDAEPAVIGGLTDEDPGARELASEVLGSLGTHQCVAALERASTDPQPRVAQAAHNALKAVQQRQR